MCTVFAESEVISLIGSGTKREDIASGVIASIAGRVKSLCQKHGDAEKYFLTGGNCDNKYIIERLSAKLNRLVFSLPHTRFAGSIGADKLSKNIKWKDKKEYVPIDKLIRGTNQNAKESLEKGELDYAQQVKYGDEWQSVFTILAA